MNSKLSTVTIVGRQNVGKSTLFNTLIKEKKAIVDSFPGLTRDIISYTLNYKGITFNLLDTPGLDLASSEELSEPILENAKEQLENSSVIIFLLEYPGPESFDLDLGRIIRKLSVPTIIAVNKMDNNERLEEMSNFYEMGFQDILPISAMRRFNIDMLLDRIIELLPAKKTAVREPDLTIAIAGRPNSGKSTLLNAFMGFERAVVSDIPGTTRDSVDDYFSFHNKLIRIVDTAGIRKKSKIQENVEFYSFKRTLDSIHNSDVIIHLIDAQVGLTETDKKIFDEIIRARKPLIIAINKWDAIEKDDRTFEQFKDRLIFKFYRAEDFPIISISAKDRQRISKLLEKAMVLKEKASRRIDTPTLNRSLAELQSKGRIPQLGHKIRIYYGAQIDTVPPQFKLFVNDVQLFRKDVVRYFEKSLQRTFDLHGIPIIIHLEGKEKRGKGKK